MHFAFRLRVCLAVIALGSFACGGPASSPGEECYDDTECASGRCGWSESTGERTCVGTCTSHADCTAVGGPLDRCGADGFCVESCEHSWEGSPCVDGVPTSCEAVDESYCGVCDGFCPGQRCVPEVGCAPLSMVGEECLQDSDCNTNNCSQIAGVCRVQVGGACDETNCDRCLSEGDWSYCSRECTGVGDQCPTRDLCIGRHDENHYWCRPSCTGCPGTCEYTSDYSTRYCHDSDWTISEPPREALQPCRGDAQCAEGFCLSSPSCSTSTASCYGARGVCTGACTSNADCGADGACVEIPCVGDDPTQCGKVCLPTCEPWSLGDPFDRESCNPLAEATCRELPSADGGTTMVCDPRAEDRARCNDDAQCQSGNCSSERRCAPAGGAPNGSSCGSDTDCVSGNCQTGQCRGTALRGESCAANADCSVGDCVDGICD